MPKTHATALWPTDALQTIATNWPTAVAARMMGRDAPTAVAGTMPASTRPSATDPTMKLGSPITAGSPASGPAMVASVGAASSTRAGGWAKASACASGAVIAASHRRGRRCCAIRRRPGGVIGANVLPDGHRPVVGGEETWVTRRPVVPDVGDGMGRRRACHHASGRHRPVRLDRYPGTRDPRGPSGAATGQAARAPARPTHGVPWRGQFDRAGAVPARPGRMRSLSGGIGARGFRIGALLLSLAATVLSLIGHGRLRRSSRTVRGRTIHHGEEPVRHAG